MHHNKHLLHFMWRNKTNTCCSLCDAIRQTHVALCVTHQDKHLLLFVWRNKTNTCCVEPNVFDDIPKLNKIPPQSFAARNHFFQIYLLINFQHSPRFYIFALINCLLVNLQFHFQNCFVTDNFVISISHLGCVSRGVTVEQKILRYDFFHWRWVRSIVIIALSHHFLAHINITYFQGKSWTRGFFALQWGGLHENKRADNDDDDDDDDRQTKKPTDYRTGAYTLL